MPILTVGLHTHTPTLTVTDPRGLVVRSVGYCRSVEGSEPQERVNRSAYDAMGRLDEQWDPRLWALSAEDAAAPPNLINRYSLSEKVLGSLSVDAGERISLFGDGDQLLQAWDSRGSERRVEYDELLRPLAIFEQGEDEAARCTERYEYANASADFVAHNQCGRLIRHDDPAGTLTMGEYALTGGVLEQTQRFLSALEIPDWPQALSARDALLEPVAQAATSSTHFNPLGDVLEQTDAKGNRQQFDYTVDGQLFATHLQLSAQSTAKTLVSDIHYNAYGQVEQETAGNGVVSTLTYRPEDGRLTRIQARHGTEAALQDLHYEYDPVGNVLSIDDAALPVRYFANQRVEPKKQFDYDSLYQLIKATGWEAGGASRGPAFNRFDDPSAVANYHQTYRYDAGGNLLELVHVGPQSHSRKLTAARYSNRCLPEQNDRPPTEEEIAAAFDGNGNLLDLQPGQAMSWDLRNQLREVRPVEREGADDDRELYLYDGDGQRRRKIRSTQTNARSLISEVRYLPGLELRTREGTGEVLQVICVQAGRSAMQVLHWESTPPSGIANDQYRYNLTDHLGSSSLELDDEAAVISQETYHPYGSTAWFAGRSEVEAGYKTVRYSGKERDATGLYYYGFRYYAPWLQRWINPDPVRDMDGLNFYRMVRNNPISYSDTDGLMPTKETDKFKPESSREMTNRVSRVSRGDREFNSAPIQSNSLGSLSPFGGGGRNASASPEGDPLNRRSPQGSTPYFFGIATTIIAANRFKRPLKPTLSNIPDVPFREIIKHLGGQDLENLSLTSKYFNAVVNKNTQPMALIEKLDSSGYMEALRDITLNNRLGYLPSQVLGNMKYLEDSQGVLAADNEPGRSYFQKRYLDELSHASYLRASERRARENERQAIEKERTLLWKKAAYGLDYHSDSSYDSD
ncbi:RHS repeat-associated core domain-containing protein [Pseudomonas gingeri]|uniref:RHS repeat-associated core domain-containing protein n=1 Tax=Pseudomonas gingeri TaxID=117681 RepID=UPI00210E7D56|nr:RHS repeat-associated core domain-containing protein [Pseudomonas gingeri]